MIIEETTEVEEKDQGFTLVELLIVIVILGILATIVVFAVRGITDKGQKSACKADCQDLRGRDRGVLRHVPGQRDPRCGPRGNPRRRTADPRSFGQLQRHGRRSRHPAERGVHLIVH